MTLATCTNSTTSGYRQSHPSDRLIAEIAWLYYIKGLTQGEVGKIKGLSRPTVMGYLKLARERGLISIKLDPLHLRLNDLADALKERFQLTQVHVVPCDGLTGQPLTTAVSEVAAHLLPQFLTAGDVVGVSWGETVSLLAEAVPHAPIRDLVVRQLIGSMANPLVMTSESCTTEIARRLSGDCINLNAPAVCTSVPLAEALRREPIIAEQLDHLTRCNKAVFSLSPCTPDTHVVHFKVATTDEIASYRARGAVCILVGRFLDQNGEPVSGDLDDRLIAIQLDDLRKMEGLLVVSGKVKAKATRAALRGGYVSELVLDAELAEAILSLD